MNHGAFDLLVLGAGPAGCAAALVAARAGATVALVLPGGEEEPTHGETLNPGAVEALAELGLASLVRELHGVPHRSVLRTRDGAAVERGDVTDSHGRPAPGLHVDRTRLHAELRLAARRAGARLIEGTRPVEPLGTRDRVRGVRTTAGDLEARFVIDASGRQRWLARRLGLPCRREGPRRLVVWGHGAASESEGDSRFDETADGWTWWAHVGAGRAAWVRCGRSARGLASPPLGVAGAAPAEGGADLSWSLVRPTAGDGFLLCGDAALLLDPSFGDGVERALRSGALAARTATLALRRPERAPLALASYDDALFRAFSVRCETALRDTRSPISSEIS